MLCGVFQEQQQQFRHGEFWTIRRLGSPAIGRLPFGNDAGIFGTAFRRAVFAEKTSRRRPLALCSVTMA